MRDIFLFIVSVLSVASAHHDVHFVPAHVLCPNVTGDQDILLPSPTDCAVYYKCQNGMAIPQSCPDGLEWCKVLSECTLPMLANCTISHTVVTYSPEDLATYNPNAPTTTTTVSPEPGFCPYNGAKLPNPVDCTSYYVCENGNAVSQSCPTGEKYSCWDQQCEPDTEATCYNSDNLENQPCKIEHEKLPRVSNCSSYYECVNGKVVEKLCPEGLYYDSWEGKCTGNANKCDIGGSASTTTSGTEPSPTTEATSNTPGSDGFCPFNGAKLPNPVDCSSYYVCENGNAVSQSCPTGEKYSCWDQQCEPDTEATCYNSDNLENQPCKVENEKLPRVNNCSSYYECVNGKVVEKLCPEGLYYNSWEGKCTDNANKCDIGGSASTTSSGTEPSPTTEATSNTPGSDGFCPFNGAKLPNPVDCTSYYVCENGNAVSQSCPTGEKYSCWDQQCEPDSEATCYKSENLENEPCKVENEKLPRVNNCSSYYECVNGKVVEKLCPEGLYYNSWEGKCTVGANKCNIGAETSSTSSNPTDTTTNSVSSSESTISTGPTEVSTIGSSSSTVTTSNPTETPTTENTETPTETSSVPPSESTVTTSSTDTSSIPPSESTVTTTSTDTSSIPPSESTVTTTSTDTSSIPPSESTVTTTSTDTSSIPPSESTITTTSTDTSSIPPSESPVTTTSTDTSSIPPSESTITTTSTDTSSIPPSEGTTVSTGSTETQPSITTAPPNPLCPKDGIMYPSYTGDCQGYLVCVSGKLVPKKCEPATYNYNCETKKCENITHCCATGNSTTTEPTPPETTTKIHSPSTTSDICPVDGAKLPNPEDCTAYYVCQNSIPVPEKCPEGEEYSCWDQECKKPTDAICINEGSQQGHSCSKEGEQNPNLEDCSSYYQCTNGKIQLVKCASGKFYNKWFKACFSFSLSWCKTYPVTAPSTTIQPPPSTVAPSPNENICPVDGARLPNVLDCNSYYVCINEKPVLQNCPSNEVYSCWDQTCLPQAEGHCILYANKPGDNCSIDGIQVASIDDCKSYYECRNNSLVIMTCPDGKMYNSWFKKCVDDSLAHCQTVPTTTATGKTTVTTPTIKPTGTPDPNVCPQDGSQLPNPTDCSKYYVCQNGKPVAHSCPHGQEYSCWDQKCMEPSSNSTCIKNGNQEGHSCSLSGLKLPNIANCSSFYICVSGKVELHVCASGAIYSSWFKACIDVSLFGSGSLALQFCKVLPTLPPFTLPPLPTTTMPPSSDTDVCPVDHALLPNLLDCSTYYECINHAPILQSCPMGTGYSCWDQKCVNGTKGACGVSSPGGTCSKDGLKVRDAEDCRKYYECDSGKVVARYCILGLQFNDRYQRCVLSKYSHCTPIQSTPPTTTIGSTTAVTPGPGADVCPNDGALLPNPVNCSTYYKCENKIPILQLCGEGLEYSCWDMACMAPADAKCSNVGSQLGQSCKYNGQRLPNPDDCHSFYECENQHVVLKKCSFNGYYSKWFHLCFPFSIFAHCEKPVTTVTTSTTTPSSVSHPEVSNDICPVEGALLPNPSDCNGYYKCINETPVAQKCPEGQAYSCWDQQCESADSAQCISAQVQEGQNCSREGVRLQNIQSCTSYFECRNGIVQKSNCFFGLEYNKWFSKCYLPLYSHCKTSKPITPPPTTTTSLPTVTYHGSVCPNDGAKVPNPNDCHTYFVCEHGSPVLHQCPNNQNYDCWDQRCEFNLLSRCVNAPEAHVGDSCTVEGETVPDIVSCKKYYECHNGQIVHKTCPFLYQYSVWGKRCRIMGLAQCANDKFLGII